MEQEEYRKMMEERGYHGLQLVHMTFVEAQAFAGDYGMNVILYKYSDMSMHLVRLYNRDGNCMVMISNEQFKVGRELPFDPSEYDIYWIGGDDPQYDSYKEQR